MRTAMLLRCVVLSRGTDYFLRPPLSRLPSTLTAKRTTSRLGTQTLKDAAPPHLNAKTSQPDSDNKEYFSSSRPSGTATPLEKFFSQFTKFQYQPSESPFDEFNRLCKEYKWEKNDPKVYKARKEFIRAIKKEFDNLCGSDETDIENWHKLCHVLRIKPVPTTLPACRAAVLTTHVNLRDLFEYLLLKRKELRIFSTEKKLSEYTKETRRYFPKDAADCGVLRALRRHILDPQDDPPRKAQK